MSPTNRPTHANTRTAVAAAQLMVMPHALHVVLKPISLGPYLDLMRETERDRHGPYRRLLSMAWAAESQRRTPEISLR